jgi:hypothetical protein
MVFVLALDHNQLAAPPRISEDIFGVLSDHEAEVTLSQVCLQRISLGFSVGVTH